MALAALLLPDHLLAQALAESPEGKREKGAGHGAPSKNAASMDGPTDPQLDEIVIVEKRQQVPPTLDVKFNKQEIVESVSADEISKLPDTNAAEALSRVSGIQVTRDRGEGTGLSLRGLTQVQTTLNGREIFTAGSGRTLEYADIPAEMLAGIDVYKTASADQIEGGIGGSIDLRMHRPFDFTSPQRVASVRQIQGNLVGRSENQYSALISSRGRSAEHGEIGALLSVSVQNRAWREDQKSAGNPTARTDIIAGQTVIAPNGTSETTSLGRRERTAATLSLQWRPKPGLEFHAEGNYAEFRTLQNSYQLNVSAPTTFAAGSATLFGGTHDLQSITWTNAAISVLSFARDTVDRTQQFAIGGNWTEDDWTLKGELSRTDSRNTLFFAGPVMKGTAASFTQDLSGQIPSTGIGGTDLLNPANYQFSSIAYRFSAVDGRLTTARLDGEQRRTNGAINTLLAGWRYARREADNTPGLIIADANTAAISATAMPGHVMADPYGFFPGSTSIQGYLVGDLSTARDPAALRSAFGVTSAVPGSNPLGTWRIVEETQGAYLMARFDALASRLEGHIGLRAVATRESVAGYRSDPAGSGVLPLRADSHYIDALPSMGLRYQLGDGLYLRGAVSRTITRPNFDQLSPSLTLNRNTITPALNQGSAGNPDLRPIRSSNLDLALERYADRHTLCHATVFFKAVDGFIATVSTPETYGGEVYQVSRPVNSLPATIKGIELGYRQSYDFLPGWLSGLGLQANGAYIDSASLNTTLGTAMPLQNLSPRSYNLTGMYDKGPFSARLAYNWRDRYLSSVATYSGVGALPIYTNAYGWLDASFSYRLNDRIVFVLQGHNLLRTIRTSYYGVETRPKDAWLNDVQISAAVTVRF